MFDVIKQSYLITSDWLNELVAGVEGVDPLTKRRVEFFTKMLTDAFSPSNFLLSNPAALREAMQTHGESLVKGMENFAADLRARRRPAVDQPDRLRPVQGRRERRHRARQGDLPERADPAPAVRSDHRDGLRDPAADLPALDQQVLHPRSAARELDDPLADRARGSRSSSTSWVNPDASARRQDLRGLPATRASTPATDAVMRQTGVETRQHRRLLHRRHAALLRAGPHGGARATSAIASATFFAAQQDFSRGRRPAALHRRGLADGPREEDGRRRRRAARPDHGRHLQRPARQRPDLVVLRQQLPDGQGAAGRSTCCSGTPTRRGCPRRCTSSTCASSTARTPWRRASWSSAA